MEKESVRAITKKRTYDVEVDEEKCIGCEECVDNCPVNVFEMQDEKSVPVNAEECVGCETCIELCEQEAITVTEID
ncbi:MAG: 4Fe-4S dicluster domain-containing protein [Desulfobacteraceae bacterium]|nr:4Fe-4S dicluster domain-containing protein [Desulfobacteraceae bacterium]